LNRQAARIAREVKRNIEGLNRQDAKIAKEVKRSRQIN